MAAACAMRSSSGAAFSAPRQQMFPRHRLHKLVRASSRVAAGTNSSGAEEARTALLLEVDGTLTDIVMDGHRQAFNMAFNDLGLDCTNWSPPLYNDLMSHSDGTGEGLVVAYFGRIGWPLSVGKGEEHVFARKVHELKQQHFNRMLRGGKVPLRQDVQQVLKQAVASGAVVALLAETSSTSEEDVVSSCLTRIDPDLVPSLRIYSAGLHRQPEVGDDNEDDGEAGSSGGALDFKAAAARVQQRAARDFVQQLQRDAPEGVVGVGIDASLRNLAARRLTPEWLAAVAATLGVPASRCLVVASSGSVVRAAAEAGMVAVGMPRQGALAATYELAAAKFEGFGPGYATWPRLQALLKTGGGTRR